MKSTVLPPFRKGGEGWGTGQTKKGNVWVAGGTLVPLVHIFEAVAGGPLPEIVEVYRLTLQQLMTLLQFAAAGLARGDSGH